MKTQHKKNRWNFLLAGAVLLLAAPMSCNDDEKKYSGDPSFAIEGDPTELTATADAITQTYVVRSNRPWKVVAQSEGTWVKAFPEEGDEDGRFKLTVSANRSIAAREMFFEFVVAGKSQPALFRVSQDAAPATLAVTTSKNVSVRSAGGLVEVKLDANIEWSYTLSDNTWLKEPTITTSGITFMADVNGSGGDRLATLIIKGTASEYSDLADTVTIRQINLRIDDGKSTGYEYFSDDFSWVTQFCGPANVEDYDAGNTLNIYTVTATTTTGASPCTCTRTFVQGSLADSLFNRGYGDINETPQSIYFASHYLKFGRTDVQTGIERTIPNIPAGTFTNVVLSFDATPCKTGSHNYDKVFLVVEIDGQGSVGVDDGTTKRSTDIDIQIPDKSTPWTWVSRSITLYGVAADSKVIIKTSLSGMATGTFRYYLDNLKIVKHSEVTP